LNGNSPVNLCCQKEIPDKYEGDCRMCSNADLEYVDRKDEKYHYIGT